MKGHGKKTNTNDLKKIMKEKEQQYKKKKKRKKERKRNTQRTRAAKFAKSRSINIIHIYKTSSFNVFVRELALAPVCDRTHNEIK